MQVRRDLQHVEIYVIYYTSAVRVLSLALNYINDVYSIIHHSNYGMFADDLSIYKEVSTTADCAFLLQELDCIADWRKALNVSNK